MAAAVFFAPPITHGIHTNEKTSLPYPVHHDDADDTESEAEDSSPEGHNDDVQKTQPPHDEEETVTQTPTTQTEVDTNQNDVASACGRRVTLVPRRTLSLSPAPARSGDMMMARNLRAARWLDFTDKDDDDGLYQPSSDSESESSKRKAFSDDSIVGTSRLRLPRRTGSLNLGYVGGIAKGLDTFRKSSMKRPLEVNLPCQEIQYLDISYQQVQFSPIARKKITYHPVPYHSIHYCEVSYLGERPVKRKPLSL